MPLSELNEHGLWLATAAGVPHNLKVYGVCVRTAAGAADKVVSGATSATKALPTKGLSTPSVPRPVKKAFTPPSRPKVEAGIGAGGSCTMAHAASNTVCLCLTSGAGCMLT